jgi:hypothetical protein
MPPSAEKNNGLPRIREQAVQTLGDTQNGLDLGQFLPSHGQTNSHAQATARTTSALCTPRRNTLDNGRAVIHQYLSCIEGILCKIYAHF